MTRALTTSFLLFWMVSCLLLGAASPPAWARLISDVSDPCQMSIDGALDIVYAWIEKDGADVRFLIETREAIVMPPAPDDQLTYLWLVDADNDPTTGQFVGNEFNVRVVVSQNHGGGWVDVVGGMPGGGVGSVVVDGRTVAITVDVTQIGSPQLFQWTADTFKLESNVHIPGNGLTTWTEARMGPYLVLWDRQSATYGVEQMISASQCDPCDSNPDLATEVVADACNQWDQSPVYCSLDRAWPCQDPCGPTLRTVTHGSAAFLQLRTHARPTVDSPNIAGFAATESKAVFNCSFVLEGAPEDDGAPIPTGLFTMDVLHEGCVQAGDDAGQASAWTYAQIVVTQLDPLEQKGLWLYQFAAMNDLKAQQFEDDIDLADYNLAFGVPYGISMLLLDRVNAPTPTFWAEAFSDCSLLVHVGAEDLLADLNEDGRVDLLDLALVSRQWLDER